MFIKFITHPKRGRNMIELKSRNSDRNWNEGEEDERCTLLLKVLKPQLQTTHRAASWNWGASAVDMIFSLRFQILVSVCVLIKSQSHENQFISRNGGSGITLIFVGLRSVPRLWFFLGPCSFRRKYTSGPMPEDYIGLTIGPKIV